MGDDKSKLNKEWDENYIKEHYDTVKEGLDLFQDDPLIYEPGKGSEYSSLAYSLVSHLIEQASGIVLGYYFVSHSDLLFIISCLFVYLIFVKTH